MFGPNVGCGLLFIYLFICPEPNSTCATEKSYPLRMYYEFNFASLEMLIFVNEKAISIDLHSFSPQSILFCWCILIIFSGEFHCGTLVHAYNIIQ